MYIYKRKNKNKQPSAVVKKSHLEKDITDMYHKHSNM